MDNYGLMNDIEILPPVLKKTAGRSSTKRKTSSVECATTSNDGHTCSLCNKGHKKNKCKKGNEIGQRLTKSIWHDKLALVPYLEEIIIASLIDPVVSSDALGLLLCVRVHVNGVDSSVDEVYRATIILSDLEPKIGAPCHLKYSTIGKWACLGNSSAKYVFIK